MAPSSALSLRPTKCCKRDENKLDLHVDRQQIDRGLMDGVVSSRQRVSIVVIARMRRDGKDGVASLHICIRDLSEQAPAARTPCTAAARTNRMNLEGSNDGRSDERSVDCEQGEALITTLFWLRLILSGAVLIPPSPNVSPLHAIMSLARCSAGKVQALNSALAMCAWARARSDKALLHQRAPPPPPPEPQPPLQ